MKSLFFVLAIVAYLATGEALKCFECTDPPSSACGRSFDRNGYGVATPECQPQSRCYISEIKHNDVEYITRGCMVTLGANSNNHTRKNSSITETLPLITFCDTDLCNSANSINIALSTFLSVVVLWIFTKL